MILILDVSVPVVRVLLVVVESEVQKEARVVIDVPLIYISLPVGQ
jgi:hypothetical protein